MIPQFTSLKFAMALAAIVCSGVGAWGIRGDMAQEEKAIAVRAAVAEVQVQLDNERALRAQYEATSTARIEELLKSISNLHAKFTVVSRSLAKEVKSNAEFYDQPLPTGGYELWKTSKGLLAPSELPQLAR